MQSNNPADGQGDTTTPSSGAVTQTQDVGQERSLERSQEGQPERPVSSLAKTCV